MAQITINEGLAWLKTLKKRHEELLVLRNDNAHRERRFYGASADKEIVKEPVYDVKILDKLVTRVAREIRLLEQALKATNAKTAIDTYDQDDAVLGELSQREEIDVWGGSEGRAVSWVWFSALWSAIIPSARIGNRPVNY